MFGFQDFIVGTVNKYMGTYFEDIDSNSLGWSLMNGKAELKNLRLNSNILNMVNLPLALVNGSVDCLCIKLFARSWYSVDFILTGLNMVMELKEHDDFDSFMKRYHFSKCSILQLYLETNELLENLKTEALKADPKASKSLSYLETVTRNISIIAEDVNITIIGKDRNNFSHAFTLSLKKLSIDATDSNWIKNIIYEKSDITYKSVTLTQLAFFHSPYPLKKPTNDKSDYSKTLLLHPIDLVIKLTLNDSLVGEKEEPKYTADVSVNSLNMNIDVSHYHIMMDLFEKTNKFREIQPESYFFDNIRYLNTQQKWLYLSHKVIERPWPKLLCWTLKLISLKALSNEYRKLIEIKYDPNLNLSRSQQDSLMKIELQLPINDMFQICVDIIEKMKLNAEANKNKSYMNYFRSKVFGYAETPTPDNSGNSLGTVYAKLPEELIKLSSKVLSFQISGELRECKISIFFNNMTNQLFSLDVRKLKYYLHYKPMCENIFKINYSIFEMTMSGWDKKKLFYIINTTNESKTNESDPFLVVGFQYSTTKKIFNKASLSLGLKDANITILLKFFIHVRKLLYRPAVKSVTYLYKYAEDKMTDVSNIITKFIQSSREKLLLNITMEKTYFIFPSAKKLLIVARFNKLHFKTLIGYKKMSPLPLQANLPIGYKYNMVYLMVDSFNILCTNNTTYSLMRMRREFDRLFMKYSILNPIKITMFFLANQDESGMSGFLYSTYLIMPELKISLSFSQIQLLKTIFNDTMDLINAIEVPACEKTEHIPVFTKPTTFKLNKDNPYEEITKILNIIVKIEKISINIKWNSIYLLDKPNAGNFMSGISLTLDKINGEYEFMKSQDQFKLIIGEVIISHHVDNWIHTTMRTSGTFIIDYHIIRSHAIIYDNDDIFYDVYDSLTELGRGCKKLDKTFKIHVDSVKLNFHYDSMQNIVKLLEILQSLLLNNSSEIKDSENISNNERPILDENLTIIFNTPKVVVNLRYEHFHLFSVETLGFESSTVQSSDKYQFSIGFQHFLVLYYETDNLYTTILKIPLSSTFTLKIFELFEESQKFDCYNFETQFEELELIFLYRYLDSLIIWLGCLNENNTLINQAVKKVYDATSYITMNQVTRNRIMFSSLIKKTKLLIPVLSREIGGVSININQLSNNLDIKLCPDYQVYCFKFAAKNNLVSRFLMNNNEIEFEELLFIDSFHGQISTTADRSENSKESPYIVEIKTSEINGALLPEDIVMLKFFLLENLDEYSMINHDKNYINFETYWGKLYESHETEDTNKIELTFQTKCLKITLLYSDEKIRRNYYKYIEPHYGHNSLMDIIFNDLKLNFIYNPWSTKIKLLVDEFKIINLILVKDIDRMDSTDKKWDDKFLFISSKQATFNYDSCKNDTNLTFIICKTDCNFDIDMVTLIHSHIIPILDDYNIYILSSAKRNIRPNFYNITFSEEFKQNRWETNYHFMLRADFKMFILNYDPEIPGSDLTFISESSIDFIFDIRNGIKKYSINISEFPIYLVSSLYSKDGKVTKCFVKIDNIFINMCYISDIISNIYISIDKLTCNISYKSFKLLLDIKDKYQGKPSIHSLLTMSQSTIESSENINQSNVFQPHNLSVYSKRLEKDYDTSTIHVDQEVYARYIDGFYYDSKVLMKFSSHYTLHIQQLNMDVEISAVDRLAIIPLSSLDKSHLKINDYVLVKNKFQKITNYKIGQVYAILEGKFVVRSFQDYTLFTVEHDKITKFPVSMLTPYRGIGLNLFCRYLDGVFYPSLVLKRKDFEIEYQVYRSNDSFSRISHKVVDDSSFALMWNFCNPDTISPGENLLVIIKDTNGFIGKVAKFHSKQNSNYIVKFFHDGKMATVPDHDCLQLNQQVYGIKGQGMRYFGLYNGKIHPILQIDSHSVSESYFNPITNKKLSIQQVEALYADIKPSKQILYPFQPVIFGNFTGSSSYSVGNIMTIASDNTYYVLKTDGCCKKLQIENMIIQNPKVHIVKAIPISLVDQEGTIFINQTKIFLESEADIEQRPLFLLNTSVDLKIYSWSKFETQLEIMFNLSISYLNTEHLYWEPFIQFLFDPNNKYKKNLRVKYTESSLVDCSFNLNTENIVILTPTNLKLYILDEINFTLSEQFFASFKMIYDDLFSAKSQLKSHNLYETKFTLFNKTLYHMDIILFDGSKKQVKTLIDLKPMCSHTFTTNKVNFDDIVKGEDIFTPSFFQKIPHTSIKVFNALNKSSVSHFYFNESDKVYSYVVDTNVKNRNYTITFRYPFKIVNLLDHTIYFKAKCHHSGVISSSKIEAHKVEYALLEFQNDFDFYLSLQSNVPSQKMRLVFSDTNFPLKYKYTLSKDDDSKIQCICFLTFDDIPTSSAILLKNIHRAMYFVISPAITVKNDLKYPVNAILKFDAKTFSYEISEYGSCDCMQLSEKRDRFNVKFMINLLEIPWVASADFELTSKNEKRHIRFLPAGKSVIESIVLKAEKSFNKNFLVELSSSYTFVNTTKHNIFIKFLHKNIGKDEIVTIPSKSILPMSPSIECEKANIAIEDSLYSESFPFNAIGYHGYLKMKKSAKSELYHNIMVSIKRTQDKSIKIVFNSAVLFKNKLGNIMRIVPNHCDVVHSIYLDKHSEVYAVLPLPELPCDFTIYLDDGGTDYPINYHSVIDKSCILFSPCNTLYFSGKCYWKSSVLYFEFKEIKAESFDYLLINYSKVNMYCHNGPNTLELLPLQQVFFSSVSNVDPNVDTKFNFNKTIDEKNPPIEFDKFEDKISTLQVNDMNIYIAKFYDVRHTAFVLTEDYNFALHCSDVIIESTWVSFYFVISRLSVSVVSSMLSKELLIISVFKNCNRWLVGKDRFSTIPLSPKFCKQLDQAYIKYIFANGPSVTNFTAKKSVDFKKMTYLEDKIHFILQLKSSYAAHMLLNISISSEVQNLSFRIDKLQIDCPIFECTNPVIFCQSIHQPTVAVPDVSSFDFLVASIFINRPVNYQNLGRRKYQNLEYFKILIQEFDISIDIPFILTIANYLDYIVYLTGYTGERIPDSMESEKSGAFKYFVKYFHLSPLKFNTNITFASVNENAERIDIPDTTRSTYFNLLTLMLLHIPLIDISKTSLNLPCLNIENMDNRVSFTDLYERSRDHYYFFLKKKYVKLFFNLKVTGNMITSASQFAHGMKSFFYEPYQGVVRSNQFGKGFLLGFKGLYSGTIGTAATALTSIGDSIGKGLATLSFDPSHEDYRNKILKIREEDPLKGLFVGGLGILRGLGSGVAGLVISPIEAFKERQEVSDIFKGMGKGLAGLITKPLGGLVDFTSTGLNLISKASNSEGPVKPKRQERCFYYDHIIRPIDLEEIVKYQTFLNLKKSHKLLANDKFVYGEHNDRQFTVISDRHVLIARIDSLFGSEILTCLDLIYITHTTLKGKFVEIQYYQSLNNERSFRADTKLFPLVSEEAAIKFSEYLTRFICP